jgi:hypothetical protein
MKRSIEQWRGMVPEAVVNGSPAQVIYCIKDAQHEILELFRETERWAAVIRDMPDCDIEFSNKKSFTAWRDWKTKYADLIANATNPQPKEN